LTASVDVQRGSEKEDGKPARLEMEVCGHGLGYRTWSIEHRVFEGPIDNPFQGAWEKLSEYWHKTEMAYPKRDGTKFRILQGLVDSGDGPHTNAVYAFTAGWNGVLPSKGMASIKRRKGEPVDEDLNRSIRRFRVAQIEAGTVLVEINGPFYKQQIYTNLKIPRKLDGPQQANFCDFPIEYGESYYKQLTAEEMVYEPDGTVSFRKSSARPNEALDLRVMNLAARDHYLNELVLYLKADAKSRGHQPAAIAVINSRTALEWLAQMVNQIPKN
jgi:phage terminase large subunit GpA-like protein